MPNRERPCTTKPARTKGESNCGFPNCGRPECSAPQQFDSFIANVGLSLLMERERTCVEILVFSPALQYGSFDTSYTEIQHLPSKLYHFESIRPILDCHPVCGHETTGGELMLLTPKSRRLNKFYDIS
eukprot:6209100-Pleurochrysis_carterae.AAC.2